VPRLHILAYVQAISALSGSAAHRDSAHSIASHLRGKVAPLHTDSRHNAGGQKRAATAGELQWNPLYAISDRAEGTAEAYRRAHPECFAHAIRVAAGPEGRAREDGDGSGGVVRHDQLQTRPVRWQNSTTLP
jgi:hypothetical protein